MDRKADPQVRRWAAATAADIAVSLGRPDAALHWFARAIDGEVDIPTLVDYADLLLDAGRPAEVISLLGHRKSGDIVLLRLAIAAKAAGDPRVAEWSALLEEGFALARATGNELHLREEARYALEVLGDAPRAVDLARRNWAVQKEPADARMLLAAENEAAVNELILLSAVLSIQDPRERPMSRQEDADRAQSVFRHESSDFLSLLKLWDQYTHAADTVSQGQLAAWCRDHFLSPTRMREWSETARQLADVAEELKLQRSPKPATEDDIHRALLTGLITNVACREGDGSFDYRGVRGNVVQIFPGSALFKKGPKWIMAAEVVQTSRLYARTVAKIDPEWIEQLAAHMFRRQITDPHLDADTGQPSAWERLSISGIVVVPRRRTPLAPIDHARARGIFLKEAIAQSKWPPNAAFTRHNQRIRDQSRGIAARLRRRNVTLDEDSITSWFAERIPAHVADPLSFESWYATAETNDALLRLALSDILLPDARHALDQTLYPDSISSANHGALINCPVEYALAPGKNEDGITVTIPLEHLPEITSDSIAWAVPGVLPDVIQALIKSLPKPQRTALEAHDSPPRLAAILSQALTFRSGPLPIALSEACQVLFGVSIDPALWPLHTLPDHLRPRVRVADHSGKEVAVGRDLADLQQRLAARAQKARAARDRTRFERTGLKTWDFGDLPESIEVERSGAPAVAFPTLSDRGDSVALTLVASRDEAKLQTTMGARRLLSLACSDETAYYLDAHPRWREIAKNFGTFGPEQDLRTQLTSLIAERAFLDGMPPLREQTQFENRRAECWSRLPSITRETCDALADVLESRARVAHRLSGGTSRLWAESIADLRENAAYLMPQGFLSQVSWERFRHYPRYAAAMQQRLLALREDGTQAEATSLKQLAPHWKRFTAWVAGQMSRAARDDAVSHEAADPTIQRSTPSKSKAPLPPARRAAAAVNLGAGEWAIKRGNLPATIDRYRWALEDFRVTLFAPELATGSRVTVPDLEKLWATVTREAAR